MKNVKNYQQYFFVIAKELRLFDDYSHTDDMSTNNFLHFLCR